MIRAMSSEIWQWHFWQALPTADAVRKERVNKEGWRDHPPFQVNMILFVFRSRILILSYVLLLEFVTWLYIVCHRMLWQYFSACLFYLQNCEFSFYGKIESNAWNNWPLQTIFCCLRFIRISFFGHQKESYNCTSLLK